MKSLFATLGRLAPSAAALALAVSGCSSGVEEATGRDLYPDVGERKSGLSACGTELVSWNGSTAYSNGDDTGTDKSCAGNGTYGLQYQCVELVMRHFTKNWGLSWYGNAEDLLDNAPTDSVDVFLNGDAAHPPVPGDMIVFGGGEVGHVALVTEVSGSEVSIIEQNVPSSFSRTLALKDGKVSPGWKNWWTKGWAHAKANGGTVGEPPGWSCAASSYNGKQYWTCDNGSLHKCENGAPVVNDCGGAGCTVGDLGTDDACNGAPADPQDPPADPQDPPADPQDPPADPQDPPAVNWSCADSSYNGGQYWTCSGGNRYRCEGGAPVEDACDQGCMSRSLGTDDLCISNASGWSCSSSAYNGGQYWTCSGGDIYRCSGGTQQMVACPSGCVVHALGTDDACN